MPRGIGLSGLSGMSFDPTRGKLSSSVECSYGCSHDGGNGIVIFGIVDRPNDRFFRVISMTHEDVQHTRNRLQKIRTRKPRIARIHGGFSLLKSLSDILIEEFVELSFKRKEVPPTRPIRAIDFQLLTEFQ